jgi:hypothetical protein
VVWSHDIEVMAIQSREFDDPGTGKHAGSVSLSGSVTSPGRGTCAAGSTEYVASDVVTEATGSAVGHAPVGESVKADACRTKGGRLTVISGSVTP